jgi:hypothetical protein
MRNAARTEPQTALAASLDLCCTAANPVKTSVVEEKPEKCACEQNNKYPEQQSFSRAFVFLFHGGRAGQRYYHGEIDTCFDVRSLAGPILADL